MRTIIAIGLLLALFLVFCPNTSWAQSSKSGKKCAPTTTNISGVLKDIECSDDGDVCFASFIADGGKKTNLMMDIENIEIKSKDNNNPIPGKRFTGVYRANYISDGGSCVLNEDPGSGTGIISMKFE